MFWYIYIYIYDGIHEIVFQWALRSLHHQPTDPGAPQLLLMKPSSTNRSPVTWGFLKWGYPTIVGWTKHGKSHWKGWKLGMPLFSESLNWIQMMGSERWFRWFLCDKLLSSIFFGGVYARVHLAFQDINPSWCCESLSVFATVSLDTRVESKTRNCHGIMTCLVLYQTYHIPNAIESHV